MSMNFCQNTSMLLLADLTCYVKSDTKHKTITDSFNSPGCLEFMASGQSHNTEFHRDRDFMASKVLLSAPQQQAKKP